MNSSIAFLDLVTPHVVLEAELVEVFRSAIRSAGFIGGPMVENFEKNFAKFCESDHSVAVNSGTDALRFALTAAGVEPGDVVVTVPHTFIATTEAISQAGATPEFVDVDERTYNMDADISFGPDHLEFLVQKFAEDPTLGVAGTVFREDGYNSETDSFEGRKHVSGQCQLFRKQCWDEIGGYIPHRAGGIDWMAVVTARMKGWKTESFRERFFFHHRHLGTAERSVLASSFSYGEKDYYLGGHPVWEMFRVAYRTTKPPYIVDGMPAFPL